MRVLRRRNQLGILLERLWQRAGAQTVPFTTTINVWPGMPETTSSPGVCAARGECGAGLVPTTKQPACGNDLCNVDYA
jgi:hypothetical protein